MPTSMSVFWSVDGESEFRRLRMRRGNGDTWKGRVRLPRSRDDYELTYFAEAEGPAGEVIARVGDDDDYESYLIFGRGQAGARNSKKSSWIGNWKVWAGVGTVALLGGTVAILRSGSDQFEGTLSPGRITLSP